MSYRNGLNQNTAVFRNYEGRQLRIVRTNAGLTQAEAGRMFGYGSSDISNFELGKRSVPEGMIDKLKRLTGF